jgi:hypothetical protein
LIIRPIALSSEKRYRIRNLDFSGTEVTEPRTGAAWMHEGLPPIPQSSFIGVLEPVDDTEPPHASRE